MASGRLVVGVTGASGAIYAQRFLREAAERWKDIYLILSDQGIQVAETELGVEIDRQKFSTLDWLGREFPGIHLLNSRDYFTPPASGSFQHDGMVIVPCSMGTAGRIAHGISDDLLTRAADVCLKERRPLVVVPREMPMSSIMLRNLATLSEAGARVVPACPAWYHRPATLEELADTVVDRILMALGERQESAKEWMV
ncbi:MAG TPA: UbiX family flavin prenyltransferase [Fimbriimonadaceae bacterium]|nr:UbiX family flavin prenyltransferase [Fimbriimonadaceae bacterium]